MKDSRPETPSSEPTASSSRPDEGNVPAGEQLQEARLPEEWLPLIQRMCGKQLPKKVVELLHGGSDRRFFRVTAGDRTFVLCHTPDRDEFDRYREIGAFFRKTGIPVPEILATDRGSHLLALEDAGDLSLQARTLDLLGREDRAGGRVREGEKAATPGSDPTGDSDAREAAAPDGGKARVPKVVAIYRNVVQVLLELQNLGEKSCDAIRARSFGRTDFRWEYTYFRDNVLHHACHLPPSLIGPVEGEWMPVTRKLASLPVTVMHRDFQSQNILLVADGFRILDFQGARRGLPHYDLAALLEDPYVNLPLSCRTQLIRFYLDNQPNDVAISGRGGSEDFFGIYRLAAISRLMQACGAFSFLGHKKEKNAFLQYIPVGMNRLSELLLQEDDLTLLRQAVSKALERISHVRD